ncbi:MAG: sulfite exporter TauE/SafE family protein [Hyphomicrobiaceae bacterium]|nr:sulfite exporter TauE/SafE family protein [Hyphomicrobiaceae bacterium]
MGQDLLSVLSGTLVGAVLGLIGGGGSILAVPLLVYVVGVSSPHVAIGTSAVAVALSALSSLVGHARLGNVRWPCAAVFTAAGILGAALGSTLGKAFDGKRLLMLFGVLMIVVAAMMLRRRASVAPKFVPLSRETAGRLGPRLAGFGLATGTLAGFFGIGGGFLVVPGLIAAADMPLIAAIGSSLVSVTAFGITTAVSYAASGLIDWRLVALFVVGGILGSIAGGRLAQHLSSRKAALTQVFAVIVASAGLYVVWRGIAG